MLENGSILDTANNETLQTEKQKTVMPSDAQRELIKRIK